MMICNKCLEVYPDPAGTCKSCGIELEKTTKEEVQAIYKKKEQESLVAGKENVPGDLPLNWFNFYTYFRLPVGVALEFFGILITGNYTDLIIMVPMAIFVGLVILGLHRRRLWGLRLNWLLLIMEAFSFPLRVHTIIPYDGMFIIAVILWVVPNVIYFEKRRDLFS